MNSISIGCAICPKPKQHVCSGCRGASYCSTECQKSDWPSHKFACQRIQKSIKDGTLSESDMKEGTSERKKVILLHQYHLYVYICWNMQEGRYKEGDFAICMAVDPKNSADYRYGYSSISDVFKTPDTIASAKNIISKKMVPIYMQNLKSKAWFMIGLKCPSVEKVKKELLDLYTIFYKDSHYESYSFIERNQQIKCDAKCGKDAKIKCSTCKGLLYCSSTCQSSCFQSHKEFCQEVKSMTSKAHSSIHKKGTKLFEDQFKNLVCYFITLATLRPDTYKNMAIILTAPNKIKHVLFDDVSESGCNKKTQVFANQCKGVVNKGNGHPVVIKLNEKDTVKAVTTLPIPSLDLISVAYKALVNEKKAVYLDGP